MEELSDKLLLKTVTLPGLLVACATYVLVDGEWPYVAYGLYFAAAVVFALLFRLERDRIAVDRARMGERLVFEYDDTYAYLMQDGKRTGKCCRGCASKGVVGNIIKEECTECLKYAE